MDLVRYGIKRDIPAMLARLKDFKESKEHQIILQKNDPKSADEQNHEIESQQAQASWETIAP